jgi:purine-nucleoside phosphorylase
MTKRWEEILSHKALPAWLIANSDFKKIKADICVLSLGIGFKFINNLYFKKYGFVHIGKIKSKKVAFANIPAGTLVLESLIKILHLAGIKTIIGVGASGGLQLDIDIGDIVIPESAYTGEGVSIYYGKHDCLINSNRLLTEKLQQHLNDKSINYHLGNIYTTASILKETDEFVKKLHEDGFLAIECEIAAMFMLAREFDMKASGVLVITDHPLKKELSTDNQVHFNAVKRSFECIREVLINYIQDLEF